VDARAKLKWKVVALFTIGLHIKDIAILEAIKNTLVVGKIRKDTKKIWFFTLLKLFQNYN